MKEFSLLNQIGNIDRIVEEYRGNRVVRNGMNTIGGFIFNLFALPLQENVYTGPNILKGVSEALGNPTSLSSYGYGLAASGFVNMYLAAYEWSVPEEKRWQKRLIHMAQYVAPIVVATANTVLEIDQIVSGDPRIDDHGLDIFMGWLAAAQVITLNAYYDIQNARMSQVVFTRANSSLS